MIVKFYVIADTAGYGVYGQKNPVTVDKYKFDWDNEEDRETVEEYLPQGIELTPANFKSACRSYLSDCDIDWGQRGVPYILLDEGQFEKMQKIFAE